MNPLRIPPGDRSAVLAGGAVALIDQFHHQSSDHRPITTCRIVYEDRWIHLRFDVRDRYVRCQRRKFQGPVYKDSCVEFFVRPKPDKGYFNFEINCGGALLVYYIQDPTRGPDRKMRKRTSLTQADVADLRIATLLKAPIDPAMPGPTDWWIEASIPLETLERYVGLIGPLKGQRWRGNFHKCGDRTSYPHWAAWRAIGKELNFHQPDQFGELVFV